MTLQAAGSESASGPEGRHEGQKAQALLDLRIKRIFDLLALIYPQEDIIKAYQNILQGTRKCVDYSLELLDNILDRGLKELLFPLIEDLPLEEKARRLKKAKGTRPPRRHARGLK